ncbi:methyltransferase domain-containing protein [Streptomyces sp. P38-E01]|uniref:Methyltransferase domain-containing protein n=1 Tax=Streptomyces tardus TaxID=2780544 RepID=A0A949N474_9ACTN|nr:class I SAM-dependent methyltransferase [Streptomyces tardus]MBU7600845.1 methyltransferase domain-containing protein [Streptomyces tardus]
MSQQSDAPAGAVSETYDVFADAGATTALGGNIHVGYWTDETRDLTLIEATDRLTDLVAARTAPAAGDHLLDVGCGNGHPALRVAEAHDVRVTGINVNAQQVAGATDLAKKSPAADRLDFRLADVRELPFEEGGFASAMAIETLLHLADQTPALRELHRVVRPGGRLVIADLCLREPFTGADRELLEGMLDVYEIARISTVEEHREQLEAAGWEVLELTDIGEQVRPSFGHAAEAFRGLSGQLPDPQGAAQLASAADLMETFGAHPQAGYALITARRR